MPKEYRSRHLFLYPCFRVFHLFTELSSLSVPLPQAWCFLTRPEVGCREERPRMQVGRWLVACQFSPVRN